MNEISPTNVQKIAALGVGEAIIRLLNPFSGIKGLVIEAIQLQADARQIEVNSKQVEREADLQKAGIIAATHVAVATINARRQKAIAEMKGLRQEILASTVKQRELVQLIMATIPKAALAKDKLEQANLMVVLNTASELLSQENNNITKTVMEKMKGEKYASDHRIPRLLRPGRGRRAHEL